MRASFASANAWLHSIVLLDAGSLLPKRIKAADTGKRIFDQTSFQSADRIQQKGQVLQTSRNKSVIVGLSSNPTIAFLRSLLLNHNALFGVKAFYFHSKRANWDQSELFSFENTKHL